MKACSQWGHGPLCAVHWLCTCHIFTRFPENFGWNCTHDGEKAIFWPFWCFDIENANAFTLKGPPTVGSNTQDRPKLLCLGFFCIFWDHRNPKEQSFILILDPFDPLTKPCPRTQAPDTATAQNAAKGVTGRSNSGLEAGLGQPPKPGACTLQGCPWNRSLRHTAQKYSQILVSGPTEPWTGVEVGGTAQNSPT